MEHLSDDELYQRFRDVFINLFIITEENKISPLIDANGHYWMVTWTHVLEEFVTRFGPYPAGFKTGLTDGFIIPRPDNPLSIKAVEVFKHVDKSILKPGSYLVKYGKTKYLRQTYERGIIRIAPAASYDDPSHNPAIRDKELEVYIQPHPSEMKFTAHDGKTGKPKGVFNPIGNLVRITSKTNYYIYCLSAILAPRLFLDFDADSCLIIIKPKEFVVKLLKAFIDKLSGWSGAGMPVKYFDPLNTNIRSLDIYTQKHFKFSYQKEYRGIWLPPSTVNELDPIIIEMGSLEDQCKFIELNKI